MNYQTKAIFAGFMGNFVEAYDVAICYYLSSTLSRQLMGNTSGDPGVVLTLIFLAYLLKPIGAFILGLYSDRLGRKRVLVTSILIAGLATALIGVAPTYERIGGLSVLLLLILRTAQGIGIGAEFLNSSSFLVESGDSQQRGFRGCWSSVGVKVGTIVACICAEMVHQIEPYLPNSDLAWRIPFLFALITMGLGLYIRRRIPESLDYVRYYANRAKPTSRMLYQHSLTFIKTYPLLFRYAFFASFLSIASSFFFYLYMPLYAVHDIHLPRAWVTLSTLSALSFTTLLIPLFGWLSDRYDRLGIITFSTTGLLLLSYPYMLAINSGHFSLLFFMQMLISIPCAGYYSVSSVLLTELFPIQIRCTALSIIFSIAASIAAGVPPVLSNYLIHTQHAPNAPCLIIMVMAAILLWHIKTLARLYRCGKNHYRSVSLFNNWGESKFIK
jgi:MHS family proline/betaine transporter-like MFS transporter